MKHLAQKLKSRRGASMLFALLVFLLCMLAGVTVLTAAAANAGRYTHLENEQRQYLSAASALTLLQAELDEQYTTDPVKIEVKCVETDKWWYVTASDPDAPYEIQHDTNTVYSWSFPTPGPDPDAKPNLTWFQYQLYANSLPAEWRSKLPEPVNLSAGVGVNEAYTVDLDRTASLPAWAGSLYPVHVTVQNANAGAADPGTAASPLALEMLLTTGDGDGVYPVRVLWSGEAVTETTSKTETTGDLTASTSGTRTTTTTLTCTLRWSAENRAVAFE